ncbi:MAG: DUF2163 domain-containing protein [Melioribacteraceae bacterium]|nr:DUF2163 domain-containing protein [Melioribacteraceae bacterium]
MPLDISPELKNHYAQTTTTLTTCIEIILADGSGVEYRFTEHDKEIEFPIASGNIYKPTSGYIPSASNTKIDLSVDNCEIIGIIDDTDLKFEDLLAGRFDYAKVEIFQVNYKDLTMGKMPIISGKIGRVVLEDNSFKAELRALTQHFQKSIGDVYSALCTADLGDTRCKVDLGPFTSTLTVITPELGSESRIFTTDLVQANGYYDLGLVIWDAGSINEYFRMDVKTFLSAQGKVELYEPMPFNIQAGDQATIITGCDKKWETCRDRYNNKLNFRGFPHLYGLLEALRGKQ